MFADKYLSINYFLAKWRLLFISVFYSFSSTFCVNYFLAKWRLLFISVFYSFSSTFCVKMNCYCEKEILFRLVKWLMYIFR